jgi:hypothetical protein
MKYKPIEISAWIRELNPLEKDIKGYRKGEVVVMIGTMPSGKKHLSISCKNRYPTWDEIKDARYILLPDNLDMAMYLPSKSEYVNVMSNCFHLFECTCYERA